MEINLLDMYPRSQRPVEERGQLITEETGKLPDSLGNSTLMVIACTDMVVTIITRVFGQKL